MAATGRVAAGTLAVLALVIACSASPDASAAASTASALVEAVGSSDGAAACALLAPAVVQNLETEFSAACEEAVLDAEVVEELADAVGQEPRESRAFGRQAQVRLEGDTVFLTLSGDEWLVTAAGCTARADQPYECTIEGG